MAVIILYALDLSHHQAVEFNLTVLMRATYNRATLQYLTVTF